MGHAHIQSQPLGSGTVRQELGCRQDKTKFESGLCVNTELRGQRFLGTVGRTESLCFVYPKTPGKVDPAKPSPGVDTGTLPGSGQLVQCPHPWTMKSWLPRGDVGQVQEGRCVEKAFFRASPGQGREACVTPRSGHRCHLLSQGLRHPGGAGPAALRAGTCAAHSILPQPRCRVHPRAWGFPRLPSFPPLFVVPVLFQNEVRC